MTEKSFVRFRGRCKTYVRKACHVWGIYDNNIINEITREHWQELHLKQCPPDHTKPDAWYESTAQKMLKPGDKFHKTFLRKDTVDIGDNFEAWSNAIDPESMQEFARITLPMMKKELLKNGLVLTKHFEYFLTGKGKDIYLKIRPSSIPLEDWEPRKEDGLPLFDSIEDWLKFLNRTTEPTLTLDTLRVRHSRWRIKIAKIGEKLFDDFKADQIIRTGKGDPIHDPENND
jgi:hypothetical protein